MTSCTTGAAQAAHFVGEEPSLLFLHEEGVPVPGSVSVILSSLAGEE